MKNYWVIGDIHGEIGLLDRLLENIGKFNPDELIFVGDYIDRGPDSREVVDRVSSLPWKTTCLMGNHELMLLDAVEDMGIGGSPTELWYYNGGEATVEAFGYTNFFSFRSDLEPRYLDFFRNLSMARSIRTHCGLRILVTHAGIAPRIPVEDQLGIKGYRDLVAYLLGHGIHAGDSFLWIRESFYSSDPSHWKGSLVVHGHTPVLKLGRLLDPDRAKEFHFVDNDLCMRREAGTGRVVSLDVDSGSVVSGKLSAAGFFEETGKAGKPVLRMRSLTVSREEIFPRDLGIIEEGQK
jgi:serine/threonine protein phosphatase 1